MKHRYMKIIVNKILTRQKWKQRNNQRWAPLLVNVEEITQINTATLLNTFISLTKNSIDVNCILY